MSKSIAPQTLRLAPDVPDIGALGARVLEDFLAQPPRVVTAARARRCESWWRTPLPGTPDENGQQHEKPRGAGTGQLLVRAWQASALERLQARMTQPRSTSPAARHWNLICHCRAHGVGAPQLVAFGENGSRQSFVIVRELADFVPLTRWLCVTREANARRRGLRSIGLALDALLRCGAWLPKTTFDNLLIQSGADECVALQLVNLRSESELFGERGLVRARLPAIAFTQFDGGRIFARLSRGKRIEFMRALGRGVPATLSERERLRVLRTALGELSRATLAACR